MSGNPWTPHAYAAVCGPDGVAAWLVNSAGTRLSRLCLVPIREGWEMEGEIKRAWHDCRASAVELPSRREGLDYLAYEFGLTDTPPPKVWALPRWRRKA
jgi:hypothetical protein